MQSHNSSNPGRLSSPLESTFRSPASTLGALAGSAAELAAASAGQRSPSATAKGYSSRSQQSSPHGQFSPTRRLGRSTGSPATHRASPRSPHKKLTIAQYQSASSEALQAEVQVVQNALGACQAAYGKALADVNRSTAKIQQLEQQVKSLQQEDAALSAKVPLPVNRLCRVRQWLSEKVTALDAEQAALEGKQMALLKAESKLRSQETEASLLDETATNLSAAAAAGAAAATHEAAEKHDREVAAAKRQLMLMASQQQRAQQAAVQEQQEADRRNRMALQCQTVARERLAGSLTAIKSGAKAAAEAAAGQHARHMESLLQLKAKVDEVREATSKNAEKTRQLRKQKREQEQREFEALQEQGLNPYEVYKVRDAEAAAAQAAAQQEARQRQRKAEIAAALDVEDRAHRRQVAKQEFDRQVEENYQRQMGITAQQQRTDAYMRAHTLTHQAILNPTSRVPVYPSDAVLVKPVGFGLGRSSPEAVRKVAAKHGQGAVDLEDCLLLPSKYRSSSNSPARKQPHRRLMDGADTAQPHDDSTAVADLPDDLTGSDADDNDDAASQVDADSEAGRDVDAPSSSIGGQGTLEGDASSNGKQGRQQRGRQMQLQTAKLSKYEAGKLEQAKQRHKAHIAQPKAAFGRVFAGDAFISDPPVVVFKDFVPGQTYKASVQLINRSFTGSSIRLLEVPTEVMHVLELEMPPSGCLAPGASATLKVTFEPLADEPLSASIPLLADSGPLGVPFKALVRQALPSIDPSPVVSVDGRAGGVMLGASGHTTATISNAGVLSMLYSVKVTGPLAATTEYEEPAGPVPPADASEEDLVALQAQTWSAASLSVAGIRVQGIKGQVGGYSSSSFVVKFTPRVAGPVEVPVLVSFTAPDFKGLAIPPIALTLTATGKDLPVSTLTPVVDFKCVMFGQSYAAPLLLANAGKSAMKVLVSARPELSEWLTFTPDFGFIQTSDTLAVSVALKPTSDMTHKLAKYLVPQQQDAFEIPIQINVPGQPLPLPVKIKLQATTSDLILSPKTLDFGRVPLTEAAGVYITISNPSALPQGYSFGSKLPLGLKLSPNAGYGRVLPRETVKLMATFQPPIPGVQYFDLTCRSLSGRLFRLEGKADGLQPDVSLSHNVIKFPATACEDSSSASLIIRNSSSDSSQLFEFGVPQGSHLKVTPRVGLLPPQCSMRVQVDFSPPAMQPQPPPAAAAAAAVAAAAGPAAATAAPTTSSGVGASSGAGAAATQPQQQRQQQQVDDKVASSSSCRYQEWLLPCYVKRASNPYGNTTSGITSSSVASLPSYLQTATLGAAAADNSTGAGSSSSSSNSSAGAADYVLHVSATTCCISPELQLVAPEMSKPPGKNYWVLDFGALPVGERATKELLLQNTGADMASLVAVPMDPLVGAFSIVNALRPLDANGGKGRVLLAFSPPDCCEYQEILTLRSSKSRLRVCLRGQGIAPTLSVSPPTATAATGGLSFGDVLLSDPVCKELKVQVTNTCPFTINYSTRFIGPASEQQQQQVQQQQQQQGAAGGSKSRPASAAKGAAAGVKPAAAAGPPAAAGAAAAATGPGKQLGGVVVQQQGTGAAAAVAPAVTPPSPPAATAEGVGIPSGCFVCKPSGGVLLAGQTQELTVVFAPLGSPGVSMQGSRGPCGPLSPYVNDRLQVLVPHQQQDVVIPLHGNAWPDGVYMSGAAYKPSSSSSTAGNTAAGSSSVPKPGTAGSGAGPVQDPFAAIMVAAAAVAPTAATSTGNPQGAKGKQAAAAATASQEKDKQGSQQLPSLQPKDVQSALAAAGYCDLAQGYVILPGPVSPGQVSTVTVDFGAVKSSAGGAAGDLVVEELPAEAKEAGWSVDPVKLSTPVGEKKPLTVRFTAPIAAKLSGTALAALAQLPVQQTVKINLVMKGGCQAMGGVPAAVAVAADGTRRMSLVCSCVLAPAQGDVAAAVPGSGVAAAAAPAAAVKK